MKITQLNSTGKSSTLEVSSNLITEKVNHELLAQAIRVYQSNLRQGTSKVKVRSEINRTKKKWFKQKGTGNARHGARTANIFVGGGVAHGPNGTQNWSRSLNKNQKLQALISAFSLQAANVVVADGLSSLEGKTKPAASLLQQVGNPTTKILIILDEVKPVVMRSLRNLENVLVTRASRVTALEIALANKIVLTSESLKALEARVTSPTK